MTPTADRPPIWEEEQARFYAPLRAMGPVKRLGTYARLSLIWFLGGWLTGFAGWSSGTRGATLRLGLFLFRYVLTWAAAAFLLWLLAPDLLITSTTGIETALGVLPAIVIAVLVLLLGSVAVIAQMAAASWGSRAPLVVTLDERLQEVALRPLVLLVAVLLLAGQVPDLPDQPSEGLAAIVSALLLATAWMTIRAARLPVIVIQALAPRTFPFLVLDPVARELADGGTGLVVFRGPMLGEMLTVSLSREDSVAFQATLQAMISFQGKYLLALHERDDIRTHVDQGENLARSSWLAQDLTSGLINAGEKALRELADSNDTNSVSNTLGILAQNYIDAGQYGDAMLPVDGLVNLGCSAHQLTPQSAYGGINFHGPPMPILATLHSRLEVLDEVPEYVGGESVATYVLAGWALVSAYPIFHFGAEQHPAWEFALGELGRAPNWDAARRLVRSEAWLQLWMNKQHAGPDPVLEVLARAEAESTGRGP